MESKQSTVFKKRFSQLRATTDATSGFAGLSSDAIEILGDEIRHVGTRQVPPEILDRIEFGCIRRQVLRGQPSRLLRDPCLDLSTAVGWQSVPKQNGLPTANVAFERLQVGQNLGLFDRARLKAQAQANAPGCRSGYQAGNCRQALPIERRHQNRSLPSWGPSAAHARSFRKPAFVQENQQRPAFAGFFLILGQRYRTQRLMASSLRSRALRSGRWQVHPNCRRSFHT